MARMQPVLSYGTHAGLNQTLWLGNMWTSIVLCPRVEPNRVLFFKKYDNQIEDHLPLDGGLYRIATMPLTRMIQESVLAISETMMPH